VVAVLPPVSCCSSATTPDDGGAAEVGSGDWPGELEQNYSSCVSTGKTATSVISNKMRAALGSVLARDTATILCDSDSDLDQRLPNGNLT
jgi:hypothetical protein